MLLIQRQEKPGPARREELCIGSSTETLLQDVPMLWWRAHVP